MSDYAAKTVRELRELAIEAGIRSPSTYDKAGLVRRLEALDAKDDPSNFADMDDEIVPAPDPQAIKPEAVKKAAPVAEAPKQVAPEPPPKQGPPPKVAAYKLTNDCRFMKPDGTTAILKAGRLLKSHEYDLERVKASGGVLAPILAGE